MSAALRLLSQRPLFRMLWLSGFISLLGDWFSFVALSHIVSTHSTSALSIALLFVLHSAPSALLAPLAGILLDRFDRRFLLVYTRWVQAGLTLFMLVAALSASILWLQVLVFLRSSLSAFVVPAEAALLRHTVRDEELLLANTIDSTTWSLSFTLGMAIGGFLAAFDPGVALLIDAATFAFAALVLWRFPKFEAEAQQERPSISQFNKELGDAWSYARSQPYLLRVLLSKAPVAFIGGSAWVLFNLRTEEVALFGSGAITFGVLQAIKGIGTALGPVWLPWLSTKKVPTQTAFHLTFWVTLFGVALFVVNLWWCLVVSVFFWGAGVGANWVLASAALQRSSPDAMAGRLFSIDYLAMTLASCVAALGGALLVEWSGVVASCVYFGLLVGTSSWLLLWSSLWLAQRASLPSPT
jgi:MFS family permease